MSTDYSLLHVYTQVGGPTGESITFRFFDAPPNPTGGGGGFQSVQRPQNTVMTAWRGPTDGYTHELKLIMDRWTADRRHGVSDVEGDCRTLEKWTGQFVTPVTQPPLLVLDANGALQNDYYHQPSAVWVIPETPVYGDVLRVDSVRVRQVVTVKFLHYIAYDELTRNRDISSQHDPTRQFQTSTAVNTFRKAAALYPPMRNAKWGARLALLNGKHDPTAKLLLGRWYKLPTQADMNEWQRSSRR